MKYAGKLGLSMTPILILVLLTITACGSLTRELEQVDADTAALQVKIKGALIQASDIDAAAIRVKAVDNTIVLSGFVDSEVELKRAEKVTAETSNDFLIVNQLKVR